LFPASSCALAAVFVFGTTAFVVITLVVIITSGLRGA